MSTVVVTGSGGLVGSEAVREFHSRGFDVAGLDNDMRATFFGSEASTEWRTAQLLKEFPNFRHYSTDIRDRDAVRSVFRNLGRDVTCVIHCAAQPSHDWAARSPEIDFEVNALGTLNILEATREFSDSSVFIHMSTNKVYGDTPNQIPLVEHETRWTPELGHPYQESGIPESMSIDQSLHSLFGASKASADLLAQEYGRNFGLKSTILRGGCLTGPSHSGVKLHGFLSYLVKCAVTNTPYTIQGHKGKQVRDNIHSSDLTAAMWKIYEAPTQGEVFNIGGGMSSQISVVEAIGLIEGIMAKPMTVDYDPTPRRGDHVWYVSDLTKFKSHFPGWEVTKDVPELLREMVETAQDRFRNFGAK